MRIIKRSVVTFFVVCISFFSVQTIHANSVVESKETQVTISKVEPKLSDAGISVTMQHTRSGVDAFYNGERVELDVVFSNKEITSGSTYTLQDVFQKEQVFSGNAYSYLLNVEETQLPMMVGNVQVGNAQYTKSTKQLHVTFTNDVHANEVASLQLRANLAMYEPLVSSEQSLHFSVVQGQQQSTTTASFPTTSKGFAVSVSVTKTSNIQVWSGVTMDVNWEAQAGLGLDDYFEVSIPMVLGSDGVGLGIVFSDANGKTVDLKDQATTYGVATYQYLGSDKYSNSLLSCNFNQNGSDQLNVKGKVSFSGAYYMWLQSGIETLPSTTHMTIYVNGIPTTIDLGLGTPDYSTSKYKLNKSSKTGVEILSSSTDASKGFYYFGWDLNVNSEGLPNVSPPDGLTMKNASVSDEVMGEGHYIDKSSIKIWLVTNLDPLKQQIFGSIKTWIPNFTSPTRQYITYDEYVQLVANANASTIAYHGGTDANKIKGFSLHLGDLESKAVRISYTSYVEDGSSTEIPSFKDQFYQSLMNNSGYSSSYFNKAKLTYDTSSVVESTGYAGSAQMSSTMTSGNLNLKIKKVDNQGNAQKGVAFTLYWVGGHSSPVLSDANGFVEFKQMGSGLYKLSETSPLAGFDAMQDVTFKIPAVVDVTLIHDYIDLANPTFQAMGGIKDISVGSDATSTTHTIINYKTIEKYNLKLYKVDAASQVLSGANFVLKQYTDDTYTSVKATYAATTNQNEFSFTNLVEGYYELVELQAPLGFVPIAPQRFVVNAVTSPNHNVSLPVVEGVVLSGNNIINQQPDPVEFNIHKVDATFGDALSGYEFKATINGVEHVFNEDNFSFKFLPSDYDFNAMDQQWSIVLKETKTPVGYESSLNSTYTIVVKKNNETGQLYIVENEGSLLNIVKNNNKWDVTIGNRKESSTEMEQYISLHKVDAQNINTILAGYEFKLYYANEQGRADTTRSVLDTERKEIIFSQSTTSSIVLDAFESAEVNSVWNVVLVESKAPSNNSSINYQNNVGSEYALQIKKTADDGITISSTNKNISIGLLDGTLGVQLSNAGKPEIPTTPTTPGDVETPTTPTTPTTPGDVETPTNSSKTTVPTSDYTNTSIWLAMVALSVLGIWLFVERNMANHQGRNKPNA